MLSNKNTRQVIKAHQAYLIMMVIFIAFVSSCHSSHTESGNGDGESSHVEEGEESGIQYGLNDKYEGVRKGVRMVLSYDKKSSSFKGTVENVSDKPIQKVRVEVHLSNKVELGPTEAIDLAPGDKHDVLLSAEGQEFKTWSTHAESGSNEHGHSHGEGGEHGHSHEGEGGHEHGEEGHDEHR